MVRSNLIRSKQRDYGTAMTVVSQVTFILGKHVVTLWHNSSLSCSVSGALPETKCRPPELHVRL
jgi:hypothetical protein